ncbi:hypothetical protein RJ639_005166 [Escallonia herrerae]|uniref:SPARK domain-containing protein n=1 Tax=Escallonia herrerae TaxID=1293975 RepID=A0AA88W275_9ASTE|nr:hypothetical protein RJ639_005166 [Escallonia herrerae]
MESKSTLPGSKFWEKKSLVYILAAWLYAAYSGIALGRSPQTASFNLPLLPDDSETCVDNLQRAMKSKGINLAKPNETCDVVYCYCGIRLHPLSCPEALSVSPKGKLAGDASVKKLERDCSSKGVNGYGGVGGCSKCLNSLSGNSFNFYALVS